MRAFFAAIGAVVFVSGAAGPSLASHQEGAALDADRHAADAPEASTPEVDADVVAIEAVVQGYFDGIGGADAARLERAFDAPNAAMVGLVKTEAGGEMKAFKDMEAVITNWAGDPSPEGIGRDGEILDMKVVDGRIAMVMFRYKDEYYDALTLLKVDGDWKIVTKTFLQR